MTNRNGYAIYWTSYNYPSGINSSGESNAFSYGPFRQRWMAQYSGPSGTETTYMPGGCSRRSSAAVGRTIGIMSSRGTI